LAGCWNSEPDKRSGGKPGGRKGDASLPLIGF
jgi:hypothetical protein